ncbi:MAG TPA: response regulator transcription factor [Chthoniobacteraceae bacterium]|jgi:DNA-binding NarL/FixJ family response regulator
MKKLLVIEDQPQMRTNLTLMLQLNGYEVAAAHDGRAGLEAIRTAKPDLILCDVMMPELDGYSVLEALRQDDETAGIPFIFLTAKGDKIEQRTGMRLGADDYLTKPVSESDLLDSVRVRLERVSALERRVRERAATKPDFSSPAPLRTLGLTEREAEVLLWVAQGKSSPDIAGILGISDATAKKHVCNILEKLGLESRSAAMLRALEVLMAAPSER